MKVGLRLFCEFFNDLRIDLTEGDLGSCDPFVANKRFGIENDDVSRVNSMSVP